MAIHLDDPITLINNGEWYIIICRSNHIIGSILLYLLGRNFGLYMLIDHWYLSSKSIYHFLDFFVFLSLLFLDLWGSRVSVLIFCYFDLWSWEGQTNGLVFPSTCYSSEPLNSHVLLSDWVFKLGSIFLGDCTRRWMVRPHVWYIYLQSLLKEHEVAKNPHVRTVLNFFIALIDSLVL